jgi:hypothetical protein
VRYWNSCKPGRYKAEHHGAFEQGMRNISQRGFVFDELTDECAIT